MPTPLPTASSLIADSWRFFVATWNSSVKISIWLLYFGLAQFAVALLIKFQPMPPAISTTLNIAITIAIALLSVWIAIRLMRGLLQLEAGQPMNLTSEESRTAWRLFLPLAWTGLLQTMVILGGLFLLIIPGVYLMFALTFSQLLVVSENLRGFQAMAASYALIQGRWWATCARYAAGSLVFGLGPLLVVGTLFVLLAAVIGPEHVFVTQATQMDPLLQATIALFQAIFQAATIPLLLGFQVKLFHALQRTRSV